MFLPLALTILAVPALFMNLTMVTNLCSIGTLFAFVLVCAGVLKMQTDPTAPKGKFKTPYLNAKYISAALFLIACTLSFSLNREKVQDFLMARKLKPAEEILPLLNASALQTLHLQAQTALGQNQILTSQLDTVLADFNSLPLKQQFSLLRSANIAPEILFDSGWKVFVHFIPFWIFIIISFLLVIWSYTKNLSLIPVLGLVSCLYMMAEIELENWIGFGIWLLIGLVIYFSYSQKNSKLNKVTS